MKNCTLYIGLLIAIFVFTGCQKDEPTPITTFEIEDLDTEMVSYTSAEVYWSISKTSATIEQVFMEYSTDSCFKEFEQTETEVVNGVILDLYSTSLSPLTPGTKYFIRCRAINKVSSCISKTYAFSTLAYSLAEVKTDSIVDVTDSSAKLYATLVSWGTDTMPSYGFYFASHPNVTTKDSCILLSDSAKRKSFEYNFTLSKLEQNTTYYFRAFAKNCQGIQLGKELSFATKRYEKPSVTTFEPTDISYTSATCGGNVTSDGGQMVTERGICYSTSSNPTISNNKIVSGSGTGTFTCNLTNLVDGTTYYVRAYATNSKGIAYGAQITLTTMTASKPTVTTNTITNISYNSATCGGNVTSDGGQTVTERGICYSTSSNPTISNNKIVSGSGTGTFTCNLTNLVDGTTYYIRAYATNSKGTSYGIDRVFTTKAYNLPTISTSSATNISYTSATCGGNVTDDGGASVTERGICYSTSSNPTISNNKIVSGSGTGTFTCNLTNLVDGTTYFVRAYATNSKGTAYGAQITLTTMTASMPTVTTASVTNISYTSATCGGNVTDDGGATVTERGICYSTSTNPTISNNKIVSGSGTGTFTCNMTGLSEGTTYYIRAYATNSVGTAYGTAISFTTYDSSTATIMYASSAKLSETTTNSSHGLHTNAFGSVYIVSHTFSNGIGVVVYNTRLTTIGDYAFYGCSDLASITMPHLVRSVGMYAFAYCSSLTSITIPNNVTSIDVAAFAYCSGLISITIPEGVREIGYNAFYGCTGLTSISIPHSVTNIRTSTFAYCSGLISITIPEGVREIGNNAFYGCSSLASIICNAETPPSCTSYTFDNVPKSIPLYVPSGSISAYQAADGWNEFTNIQPL